MAQPRIHNPVELGNDFGHIKFGHINMNKTYAGVIVRNGHPGQINFNQAVAPFTYNQL